MNPIPGLPGYYASDTGAIVSDRSGRLVEVTQRCVDGYMYVTVAEYINGRKHRRRRAVHRLVLLAFKGAPCGEANHARHLDGCRVNNTPANLQWGTPKDNARDAIAHGTLGKGMASRRRKLSEDQVLAIRFRITQGERGVDLAKEFGVSKYYPTQLAGKRNWDHLS